MKQYHGFAVALLLLLLFACRKTEILYPATSTNPVCWDCDYLEKNYRDSQEHPTILGADIRNPYLLPVMEEAFRNLHGRDPGGVIRVTHYYWRISPRTYAELARLESSDLEVFDYPLDRQLLSEGDFYTAPGKDREDIPDYYAVLEAGVQPPSGIEAHILDAMYIPDNDPLLENEALRLTGNLGEGNESMSGFDDPSIIKKFDPDETSPVEDGTLPSQALADCAHYPSGQLMLEDEYNGGHALRAVRQVRVVIKRLFKVERVYTDDAGRFYSRKYFRNKYTILVKFKNNLSHIARMRPRALHEQFFPIKLNLGKWSRLDCNHVFAIGHPKVTGRLHTSHWCAALAHNALIEHREMCAGWGIELPPAGLHLMLSSTQGAGNGNAYMLNQILYSSPAVSGTEALLAGAIAVWVPVAGAAALVAAEAYKARSPDIRYGYGGDPAFLMSDRYSELVYHELAHASMYKVVGNEWWIRFGLAESGNDGPGFYGRCCTDKAYHIALGEGWAYFAGHYFTARRWGMLSTRFPEQGNLNTLQGVNFYSNVNGMSSHERFLESYDPHRTQDESYWIPKGLFYDLIDPPVERFPENNIIDRVGGFTPGEIFAVISKDTRDIRGFREKLIRMYPRRDTSAVRDLFAQYGY